MLEQLVCQEKVYLNPAVSFGMLCRWIGVDRCVMDATLERELGMDGDAMLLHLRRSEPARLSRKYGIKCFF